MGEEVILRADYVSGSVVRLSNKFPDTENASGSILTVL